MDYVYDDKFLDQIENLLLEEVQLFFENNKIEENHTFHHSKDVLNHLDNCLKYENINDNKKIISLKCAAILHDVDDKKFFSTKNYENARSILQNIKNRILDLRSLYLYQINHIYEHLDLIDIDLIIKIISLVSFSDNGLSKYNISDSDEWMLLVRYCDQLESIGNVGIVRAYTYTLFIGRPFYIDSTPRPKTIEEIDKFLTIERYQNYLYTKKSESMIDHFFDKILFVCNDLASNTNPYIFKEAVKRKEIIYNFILNFGKNNDIDIKL